MGKKVRGIRMIIARRSDESGNNEGERERKQKTLKKE